MSDPAGQTLPADRSLSKKATRIDLFKFSTPQMRAFHMSWFAFFLCFLAWFGLAPLMAVVREEMKLTPDQIGWLMIGSVSVTVVARLMIGWLCDRIGPRLCYTGLLIFGSLPVMGVGFAEDFETLLAFRVAIGAIGASFVITQYHTSVMFASNVVGTANATTAGWGNLGGGVTQFVMPFVMTSVFMGTFGFSDYWGWRASMFVAGAVCFLTGVTYYLLTQDTPAGNLKELRAARKLPPANSTNGTFAEACRDPRVWALFVIYGACFGVELTINNMAALHFADNFEMGLKTAGMAAAAFGLMNLFARSLGGYFGDVFGGKAGLRGRVLWLFAALFAEGLALMLFSQTSALVWAIPALILFSLFTQMSEGATFSVVPFINKKCLGSVAGIVGAGGNAGAVAAGFLFKTETSWWPTALLILGGVVTCVSFLAFAVRFAPETEAAARREFDQARGEGARREQVGSLAPAAA